MYLRLYVNSQLGKPVNPALERPREEEQGKMRASLGCIVQGQINRIMGRWPKKNSTVSHISVFYCEHFPSSPSGHPLVSGTHMFKSFV